MIEDFFLDLDRIWKPQQTKILSLYTIGSTALFLQGPYIRGTKDTDVLKLETFSADEIENLHKLAGKGSRLAKRHLFYLDLVNRNIPFFPRNPVFHPVDTLNQQLTHFSVFALDIIDVVVTKLKPFRAQDVDDIRALIKSDLVNPKHLVERFQSAVDHWWGDARAEDFHLYIQNLHTIQRDFLNVEETEIILPRWLND
ncbi:MAG: hypothetical protein HY540_05245 [Deltaproteobacteria bacterium]|nr:hypothetical protein [Deltaproteobacteria bacterium]